VHRPRRRRGGASTPLAHGPRGPWWWRLHQPRPRKPAARIALVGGAAAPRCPPPTGREARGGGASTSRAHAGPAVQPPPPQEAATAGPTSHRIPETPAVAASPSAAPAQAPPRSRRPGERRRHPPPARQRAPASPTAIGRRVKMAPWPLAQKSSVAQFVKASWAAPDAAPNPLWKRAAKGAAGLTCTAPDAAPNPLWKRAVKGAVGHAGPRPTSPRVPCGHGR
jgi:hypothetical protein